MTIHCNNQLRVSIIGQLWTELDQLRYTRVDMARRNPNYSSYMLRLWRQKEGSPWRFSLESVATGEKQPFSDLDAMFAYLNAQIGFAPEIKGNNPMDRTGAPLEQKSRANRIKNGQRSPKT